MSQKKKEQIKAALAASRGNRNPNAAGLKMVETPGSLPAPVEGDAPEGQEDATEDAADAPVKPAKKPKNTDALPPLPKIPGSKRARKPKVGMPCACGCAQVTRGGRFIPGHDSRLHAWALRVERGVIKSSEVPEMHRDAVKALLKAGGGTASKQALATVGVVKAKASK